MAEADLAATYPSVPSLGLDVREPNCWVVTWPSRDFWTRFNIIPRGIIEQALASVGNVFTQSTVKTSIWSTYHTAFLRLVKGRDSGPSLCQTRRRYSSTRQRTEATSAGIAPWLFRGLPRSQGASQSDP